MHLMESFRCHLLESLENASDLFAAATHDRQISNHLCLLRQALFGDSLSTSRHLEWVLGENNRFVVLPRQWLLASQW